jgi:bifunctional non-homologous end joining protein LigD
MSGGRRVVVNVAGRELSLSNLHKVFWPGEGYTKGDMIEYYVSVAPYLLPHVAGRPLNLTRFPDGIDGKHFYQKDIPETAPPWVTTFHIPHTDHFVNYCLADSPATLAWLAQWGCLEIHPWLSRVDALDAPDYAVFDFDPSEPAGFPEAVEIAFLVRRVLGEFGLRAYPKTSGATGVHVYLPIVRRYSYKEVERFVGRVADLIHQIVPDRTTRERTVAKRRGIYIDHLQNIKGKTLASVYSLRPRPGATVSAPVTWEELPGVRPEQFNIRTVPERLGRLGDLFAPALSDIQDPGPMMAALGPADDDARHAGRKEQRVRPPEANRPLPGGGEGAAEDYGRAYPPGSSPTPPGGGSG